MNILQYGGGGASGPTDYAIVSNLAGQVLAPVNPHLLVIDAVQHLGASFTAVIGDPFVHLSTGVYLAFCDVYLASGVLGEGYVRGWPGSNIMPFNMSIPCVAAVADTGAGIGAGLIVATIPVTAWINAAHSDTADRSLAGDLCIVRLGSI